MRRHEIPIRTTVANLTAADQHRIRLAAIALRVSHEEGSTPSATVILPGRPETFVLREAGRGFVLEVVS
jgi:hypothetical protein